VQAELETEYMGIYTNEQMVMHSIYGQISYNCCLSNALQLKLGHHLKIFLVKIRGGIRMEISDHAIQPAKVIRTSQVQARYAHLLLISHTLRNVLKRVEDRRERRIAGKRMLLVLM